MALKEPESMDECLFFTRRTIGEKEEGRLMAWVLKRECPKCHKSTMGKPVEKGKVKIRAKEYVCPGCGYIEEKIEHEQGCVMNVQYTCPFCKKSGEATTEYKKKTFEGVPAYIFECASCKKKIGITKKMKEGKKKKGAVVEIEDDDDF